MVGHWNEAHSGVGRGPQWLGEGHSGWMRDIKVGWGPQWLDEGHVG